MRDHSNLNEFDLRENGHVGGTHFHMNGFTLRLVLKQRQKGTWKWLIQFSVHSGGLKPMTSGFSTLTT